jgi:transposase
MLWLILIVAGLRIMMGQHDRSEVLFYYFGLEDQLPETHLLRLIEKHISFALVRERLKQSYSDTGRPSIDPELVLRILLIGYRYGVTRERRLVEELRRHRAWRWFTGLSFDQEIPQHWTFSKNWHGRFHESKLFEQWREAAEVHDTLRPYRKEVEQQNPVEEPVNKPEQGSTTDPDSTSATKGGTPARLGYYDNYLVENLSCVVVGVPATAARLSQETVAAQDMIIRFVQRPRGKPASITPYMGTRDRARRKNHPGYGPERFPDLPESNRYRCPAGERLNYVGLNVRHRAHAYSGSAKRCGTCSQKAHARVDDINISRLLVSALLPGSSEFNRWLTGLDPGCTGARISLLVSCSHSRLFY